MHMAQTHYKRDSLSATWFETSMSNVVITCAAIAVELAYKSLLLTDGRSEYAGEKRPYESDMPYKHPIRELHDKLRDDRKAALDPIIDSVFGRRERFFDTMDEHINHTYRRYWFMGSSVVGGSADFYTEAMVAVHQALLKQIGEAWEELQADYRKLAGESK